MCWTLRLQHTPGYPGFVEQTVLLLYKDPKGRSIYSSSAVHDGKGSSTHTPHERMEVKDKIIHMLSHSPQQQQEKEARMREIQNTVCILEKHQQRAKHMEQGAGHSSAVKPAETSSETPSGGDSYRKYAS